VDFRPDRHVPRVEAKAVGDVDRVADRIPLEQDEVAGVAGSGLYKEVGALHADRVRSNRLRSRPAQDRTRRDVEAAPVACALDRRAQAGLGGELDPRPRAHADDDDVSLDARPIGRFDPLDRVDDGRLGGRGP
jgi:hypothetical protein